MKKQKTTLLLIAAFTALSFSNCKNSSKKPDAYGVIGATEIIVSSENNGKMLIFDANEGDVFQQGDPIGCIDTFQLHLQLKQVEASISAALAKRPDMPSQIKVLQDKLNALEKERTRISNLVAASAASTKDLDAINAEIEMTQSQLLATKSTLSTTHNAILEEVEVMHFQKLQLEDALAKCHIKSPINGTLLNKFIEKNELAFQGKPLFKMADLENMYIKVYVTQDMLSSIKIGDPASVILDGKEGSEINIEGNIGWISPKAEFTPKMILTKNERVNLVYAVKVLFTNDGSAKIGMPGEVVFSK